jgi:hypothetical protein
MIRKSVQRISSRQTRSVCAEIVRKGDVVLRRIVFRREGARVME